MLDLNALLEQLNSSQRQAVTHGEGPLLVLAGPGSGKTTVIIKRIQYLIQEAQIPPEQILVITFTKDAAKSMQQRFLRQSKTTCPVNFGTFHSFFYHILLQSPGSSFQTSHRPQILSETQKKKLLLPIAKKFGECEDAAELLSAISFYKNTEDLQGTVKKLAPEWKERFEEIFAAYQQSVRRNNALDFDDMVYECRRMLKEEQEIRSYWQGRFSHILIDEFQDINPMQYQVVKLLTRAPYHLFAVGDDDQAIYGFRGSNPACLKRFAEEFHAAQVVLDLNYRSRQEIVEASLRVIGENRERFAKNFRAAQQGGRDDDRPVVIRSFEEREQETLYLKEEIEKFRRTCPGKSCAVLFRTNTFMQSFGNFLAKEGIPYTMHDKPKNLYEHFVVRDVMAYLLFAAGDRRRSVFLQFMNKPSRYLKRDALADMEQVDWERLVSWYRENGGVHRTEYLETLSRLQTQIKALEKMPPRLAVNYVCKAAGYEAYLKEMAGKKGAEKLQEWLDILEWLKADAGNYVKVRDWAETQDNYEVPPVWQGEEGVQLMTVHASKGLEFDRVWMPDCNEKNYPHGAMPDAGAVEEERRIFYVGMTRAKTNLELLYLTGTGERPKVMTRFLNPIEKDVKK